MTDEHGALVCSGDSDYILKAEEQSCWVTVDNISVYIIRTDVGVDVELYPHGEEHVDCLTNTRAYFHEAQAIIDDCKKERGN